MSLVNSVSQTSLGNTVMNSSGGFQGVASTSNGQILQATSSSPGYVYSNPYQTLPVGGYINETIINLGLNGAVQPSPMPLASSTNPISSTPYNSAAQSIAVNFIPSVTGSTLVAVVATSVLFEVSTVGLQACYSLVYLNGTGNPVFGNYLASSYQLASPKIGGLFGGVLGRSFTAGVTQTLNLCLYALSATNTPIGPYGPNSPVVGGDYIKIIEFMEGKNGAPQANPASPVQAISTTNTGQLISNFYVNPGSSLTITGSWVAFDFTTCLTGNGGTFTLMAQSTAAGVVTFANNIIIQNTVMAQGQAPYIFFQISGTPGQISLYGVGNGINTYQFSVNFALN